MSKETITVNKKELMDSIEICTCDDHEHMHTFEFAGLGKYFCDKDKLKKYIEELFEEHDERKCTGYHPEKLDACIDEDGESIGISDNRLFHTRGIARMCYKYAYILTQNPSAAQKLFVLGWNHDIGYEFSAKPSSHPYHGASVLTHITHNGEVLGPIKNHGDASMIDFNSFDEIILNIADLTVDSAGNTCTMDERLEDIASRYGSTSREVDMTSQVVEKLKQTKEYKQLKALGFYI